MLSGKVPFPGRTEPEIIHNVIKGVFHFNHPAFETVSDDCKDLIKHCLVKDSESRYTAQNAMAHKWMLKGDSAMSSGTIGGGVSNTVISGIDDILKQSQVKNAAL